MKRGVLVIAALGIIIAASYFIKEPVPFAPVTGNSMAPVLIEGDIIRYEKISACEIEVGDIIVYRTSYIFHEKYDSSTVVTHRVVEIRDTGTGLNYRTKGDNNPAQDHWCVRYSDIIGKVGQRIAYLGFPLLFLKSLPGQILVVIIFLASALCLYADEIRKIRRKKVVGLFTPLIGQDKRDRTLIAR